MYWRSHGGSSSISPTRSQRSGIGLHSSAGTINDDICDSSGLGIGGDGIVVVLRVFRDDVPGMEQAGDEAEHAEADVD